MNATPHIWIIILGLGAGSFFLRFVFLGWIGNKDIPPWILRHLRYTAVAILPALVAPMVLMPAATGGQFDVPRFAAGAATLAVGYYFKSVLGGMIAGGVTLYGLLYLL